MGDSKHRILIADKFSQAGVDQLKALGCEVRLMPDLSADDLAQATPNQTVLIVRSTKVRKEAIQQGKDLQLVLRAGAGVDNIDLPAAAAVGIYVANCPGKNAHAVAELAIGLMLAADRRIPQATADLKAGSWNKKEYSKAGGLYGRTLGLIGVGQIGVLVVKRAKALGMKVLAHSRSLTPERASKIGVEYRADPLEVAREADVVSLHVASNPETKGLVNAAFLKAMKPGAILINTARGEVVDIKALEAAVKEKGIRPALDVFEGEPGQGEAEFELSIKDAAKFIGTPHIGASTDQAQEAIADEAVRIVSEFVNTGNVPNCVNLAEHTPAKWMLIVRHFDQVGVLAGIFSEIRGAGINVQRTSNIVFSGAKAAVARIELDAQPSAATLETIRNLEHVLGVESVGLEP